ncbi:hypothetical protein H9Q74_012974 [Fusarium xylarioides]|nr:hypothetical protein H9Q74_012974 [Fusarium xylarioides]KAG5821149.1 hypothetical protein H9Q71_000334 [Fusarium xylarioides]
MDRSATAEEALNGAFIPHGNWEYLRKEDEDVGALDTWEDLALREVAEDTGAEQSEVEPDQPTGTDEGLRTSRDAKVSEGLLEGGTEDQAKNSDAFVRPYPTPVSLTPTALLTIVSREVSGDTVDRIDRIVNLI